MTLIVFCVISVVIVLISFFQRRSEAKIRRNYIRQHRIVLSLLVLLWIAPIWSNILLRMDLHATLLFDVVNKAAFFCIVSTTGVITIARMAFDKFLRQRVSHHRCRSSKCCACVCRRSGRCRVRMRRAHPVQCGSRKKSRNKFGTCLFLAR